MSHFLRYGGAAVGHDTLLECDSVEAFLQQFSSGELAGSCETAAVLGWRLIKQMMPDARIAVVRRDSGDVAVSLAKQGLVVDPQELEARAAMLDHVAEMPGVLNVQYEALSNPMVASSLFEFCLLKPFDFAWWESFDSTNIQIDMPTRIARLQQRQGAIAGLKAEVIAATKRAPLCQLH